MSGTPLSDGYESAAAAVFSCSQHRHPRRGRKAVVAAAVAAGALLGPILLAPSAFAAAGPCDNSTAGTTQHSGSNSCQVDHANSSARAQVIGSGGDNKVRGQLRNQQHLQGNSAWPHELRQHSLGGCQT